MTRADDGDIKRIGIHHGRKPPKVTYIIIFNYTTNRRKKKVPDGTFFKFMSLRGTAHKGAQSPPLCEFPAYRSGDSALRPQTDSGLPAFRLLGRDKILCKSVQNVRSVETAVKEN